MKRRKVFFTLNTRHLARKRSKQNYIIVTQDQIGRSRRVYLFLKYVLIIIFWSKMQKSQETPAKSNPFFQKFNGKVSKVPRLGINALLLKQEFDDIIYPKIDLKKSKIKFSMGREDSNQFSKTRQLNNHPTPQPKIKLISSEQIQKDELKLLRRYPSERLPLISDIFRESNSLRMREKVKSEENGVMNNDRSGNRSVIKYKNWKYPPRLSEQALRFFMFAAQGGQKSTKN